jgi:hypothetical protein
MAICNVFKELSKSNGTFFTFSQYAEDLTINQSNSSYKVIPSRFICCDVDYSLFSNKTLPELLQNNFENGCAFLRDKLSGTQTTWTPAVSKNLFWNEVGSNLIISSNNNNIVYCGDINIQSYSEKDNVGYNEIYCYIPNDAKQMKINIIRSNSNDYIQYDKNYICGYNANDVDFNGLLDINSTYFVSNNQLHKENISNHKYIYSNIFDVDLEKIETIVNDSFKFNTVVVFYDIYEGDNIKYLNIPLGMFVTGMIDDGKMNNSIVKFVSNNDIYGAGTSYGLRICNRFTVSSNGVTIKSDSNIVSGEDAVYSSLSQAMSAMVDSQSKMDQLVNNINEYQNGIKDHLAMFKNYRVNVPYVKTINNTPYWFINGKNTGQKIHYDLAFKNSDNVIIADTSIVDGNLQIELTHKDFLGGNMIAGDDKFSDTSVSKFGDSATITLPVLNINSSGHITGVQNKTFTIAIPNIPQLPDYDDSNLMKNDGSNYVASLDLVEHSITPKWTIKKQDNTFVEEKTDMTINVENGAKVDFYGQWSYAAKGETTKLPTSCSGDWGNELPGVNTPIEKTASSLTSTTSYSQTIKAPKSGLEVKNNKVVKAVGSDTSKKTVSVTFKPRIYYGATTLASISSLADLKTLGKTELNTTFEKTFNVDCGEGKYIYLVYPKSMSGNPSFNIGGFDVGDIIEKTAEITNEYGLAINYNILRVSNIQTASKTVIVTKK